MKRKRKGCSESDLTHSFSPDDRISRLPDDILVHVLCSMTIKEATVTSLLSRRWRYMCASLHCLDFNDSILLGKETILYRVKQVSEFTKRVKKVIKLYKGHNVEDFRLRFSLRKPHTKFIDFCLNFALSHKLQNLELDFNYMFGTYNTGNPYVFQGGPSNPAGPSTAIGWSSFPGYKSLKSLCFKSIIMGGDVLEGLLSDCPLLEMLTLCCVSNLGCVKVVGMSLRLKHLEMVDCPGLNEVEIYDAPIVSLKRWWCGEVAIRMNKVPHLVELSMSTCLKAADEIPLFCSCLSHLESLKLRLSSLYDRKPLEDHVLCLVSKLTKLRELEILCEPDLVKDLLLLVPLIQAPPNLHKIVIRVLRQSTIKAGSGSVELREVERCVGVLEHLKVLEFAGYRLRPTEDEFISYISKNAAALDTIIIDPNYQNEPTFNPPDKEARAVEEFVSGYASQWLEKFVPPTVQLDIKCLKPPQQLNMMQLLWIRLYTKKGSNQE